MINRDKQSFSIKLIDDISSAKELTNIFIKNLSNGSGKMRGYDESTGMTHINENGFRSDSFTKVHNGKHIVFAGCSSTFGVGLDLESTWAYKTYCDIAKKEKLSGFFNLGSSGASIFEIVSLLFKYFNKYGNPDTVFVNLPNISRFIFLDKNENKYKTWHDARKLDKNEDVSQILKPYVYHYLLFLEQYCISNNIDLYIYSWSDDTSDFLLNTELDSFYAFTGIEDFLNQYVENNPKDKYALTAKDNEHHGTGFHMFWSYKILQLYMNGVDKK